MPVAKKLTKVELIDKLKNVELISIDADGTLTNGSIYMDGNGNHIRSFYAHDGTGLSMIRELGIKIVLLTSSNEKVFSVRSEILNCDYYISGTFEKGKELANLSKSLNISLDKVMHIGDDVNDISALLKVGFPITVNNAVSVVKDICSYVTEKNSSKGAVREICELILIAKTGYPFGAPYVTGEDYKELVKKYSK